MPLAVPGQQEVARETSTPLLPKNWASHLLSRGTLGSQNRKKESKIAVARRQRRGKARESRTKEGPRTKRELQVKQTALQASPVYIGQAQGKKKKQKRGSQN